MENFSVVHLSVIAFPLMLLSLINIYIFEIGNNLYSFTYMLLFFF